MTLEMRSNCERCQILLGPSDEAHICSYECTFCSACVEAMDQFVPTAAVSW